MAQQEASLAIVIKARNDAEQALKSAGLNLRDIAAAAGTLAVIGVGALAATGVAAVHMAGDFQTATTAIVTGAGEDQKNLGLIREGLLQLSGEVGKAPTELAQGLYFIESAGYHGQQGLTVLRTAAIAARVGMADTASVADALTSALNAYHLPASQAAHVSDLLLTTVAQGKMHMSDLADNIGKVLPVASTAHISLAELGAAIATMTMQGTDAAQATTALRFLITNLEAPSSKAATALKSIGLSAAEVQQELTTKGLQKTLQDITTHLNSKFPEGSQKSVAALDAIVGGTRGMTAALELTGGNMAAFQGNINAMAAASQGAGKTMEGWKEVQGDMNLQLDRLHSALDVALIRVGTQALPIITQLAKFAADNVPAWLALAEAIGGRMYNALVTVIAVIQALNNYIQTHKTRLEILAAFILTILAPAIINYSVLMAVNAVRAVIQFAVSLATGTAALVAQSAAMITNNAQLTIYAARQLMSRVATLASAAATGVYNAAMTLGTLVMERGVVGALAYIAVQGAMRVATLAAAAAQFLFDAAMDANPIGLVVIAIALLAAGVIYAYTHFKPFHDAVNTAFDLLKKLGSMIAQEFGPTLQALVTLVGDVVQAIVGFFTWLFHELVGGSIVPDLVNAVLTWFTLIYIRIPLMILGMVTSVIGHFISMVEGVVTQLMSLELRGLAIVIGFAQGVVATVSSGLAALPGEVWGAFMSVVSAIEGAIGAAAGAGSRLAGAVVSAVINGLAGLGGAVRGMVAGAVGSIGGEIQGALHNAGVPGFQHGAYVPGHSNQLAFIGEGPEGEWVLPESKLQSLLGQAGGGNGNQGPIVVQLMVDGKKMSEVVMNHAGRQWKLQGGRLGSGA